MTRRDQIACVAILVVCGLIYVFTPTIDAGVTSTGVSNRTIYAGVNRIKVDDSTGSVVLVTGSAGKRVQIWGCTLTTASGTTMEFSSSAVSLTGPLFANAIEIDPPVGRAPLDSAVPWLEGSSGGDITLTLGSAVRVTGQIIWTQLP